MRTRDLIIISLLSVFLIISVGLNIISFSLIKDKDKMIDSCGFGYWEDYK